MNQYYTCLKCNQKKADYLGNCECKDKVKKMTYSHTLKGRVS